MESIRIDLGKLLGFKIVANSRGSSALEAPKIGGKVPAITGTALDAKIGGKVPAITSAALGAKIGGKVPVITSAMLGAKIGLKPNP